MPLLHPAQQPVVESTSTRRRRAVGVAVFVLVVVALALFVVWQRPSIPRPERLTEHEREERAVARELEEKLLEIPHVAAAEVRSGGAFVKVSLDEPMPSPADARTTGEELARVLTAENEDGWLTVITSTDADGDHFSMFLGDVERDSVGQALAAGARLLELDSVRGVGTSMLGRDLSVDVSDRAEIDTVLTIATADRTVHEIAIRDAGTAEGDEVFLDAPLTTSGGGTSPAQIAMLARIVETRSVRTLRYSVSTGEGSPPFLLVETSEDPADLARTLDDIQPADGPLAYEVRGAPGPHEGEMVTGTLGSSSSR